MTRISSRTYSWSHIEIRLLGKLLVEVTGIEWDHQQEMEFIYGKGTAPLDIAEGNESTTGNLSLLQGALEDVLDVSPEGKLVKLKDVDIQVALVKNPGDPMVRYSLSGIRFTSQPMSLKQNDKRMEVNCPFMALGYRRIA
jgi:hypothetical protein